MDRSIIWLKICVRFSKVFRCSRVSSLTEVNLMKKLALNGLHRQILTSRENFLMEISIQVNWESQSNAVDLFACFDQQDGIIDKRQYLVYASLLNPYLSIANLITPVFIVCLPR